MNSEPPSVNQSKRFSPLFRSVAYLVALAVLVILGIQFWGLSDAKPSSDLGLTHVVQKGDLIITVSEQGTLESSNNTEIKSRIRGGSTVTWVIKGGTDVEPSELLVQLDTKRIEDAIGKHSTDIREFGSGRGNESF